jgi:hypothetical protein
MIHVHTNMVGFDYQDIHFMSIIIMASIGLIQYIVSDPLNSWVGIASPNSFCVGDRG